MATCTVWLTGAAEDCDCNPFDGWSIRKDTDVPYHCWRIYRRTADNELLPMMRCSSFPAAVAMVSALIEVRTQAFGDPHNAH